MTALQNTEIKVIHQPTRGEAVNSDKPYEYNDGEVMQLNGMIVQFVTNAQKDKALSPMFIYETDGFRPVTKADLDELTDGAAVLAAWGIDVLGTGVDSKLDIGSDADGNGLCDQFNTAFGDVTMQTKFGAHAGEIAINEGDQIVESVHNGKHVYAVADCVKDGTTTTYKQGRRCV